MSMGFETPFGQAAIFIYQLLKNHINEPDVFEFAKELMTYPKQFSFAYSLNNWFRSGDRKEDKIFAFPCKILNFALCYCCGVVACLFFRNSYNACPLSDLLQT